MLFILFHVADLMGGILSRIWWGEDGKTKRILMLGLDAAGKTTILYKLKLGSQIRTIPTIGFNVETVYHQNLKLTIWDVGGQEKIRPLWKHYYQGTDALIFVVDSNDTERIDKCANSAAEELGRLMSEDELKDVTVLVFANKQDLPHAVSASELTDRLKLPVAESGRWFVQPCIAETGDGLYEGLDWLAKTVNTRKKN